MFRMVRIFPVFFFVAIPDSQLIVLTQILSILIFIFIVMYPGFISLIEHYFVCLEQVEICIPGR